MARQFKQYLLPCCPCVNVDATKQNTSSLQPCPHCLGKQIVYKDREGALANLDGQGNFDIVTCEICTGSSTWIECCADPQAKYLGIVKRGRRASRWFEFFRRSSDASSSAPPQDFGDMETLFGVLAKKCGSVALHPKGSERDYDMKEFIGAVKIYCDAFGLFGSAASLVIADVSKNLQGVQSSCEDHPHECSTLRGFLRVELESGLHDPGPEDVCKLKDPSGAMQLQWLLRGLEFVASYLDLLFQGDTHAAGNAYSQTLSAYHGSWTSMGFKAALLGMPSREGVCQVQALCPRVSDEKEREALISHDVQAAVDALLPLVKNMICTCREFQLWDMVKV